METHSRLDFGRAVGASFFPPTILAIFFGLERPRVRRFLEPEDSQQWMHWERLFSSETQFDPMLRDFTEAVVDPFVNFLHDQIDEARDILYLIERFRLKAESPRARRDR